MICPLFYMGAMSRTRELSRDVIDCPKEECAWWDKDRGVCSVALGASVLSDICSTLSSIGSRMPHKGQFRERG